MTPVLLLASVATPLLVALGGLVGRGRRGASVGMVLAPVPAWITAVVGSAETVRVPWLLLDGRLALDEIGRTFLLSTSLVWLLAGLYAQGYLRHDGRRAGFRVFHLLAMAGNLGLVMAADLASFYFFFALMSFSAYGLVIHDRTPEAFRAGRVYIAMAVLGDAALLAGALMVAAAMPDPALIHLPDAIAASEAPGPTVWLLAGGLGVKAAALPLHPWLPLAHPVAPTPASAALSGAMIKAGLLGWLRLLPLGAGTFAALGTWAVAGGLAAAFLAVLVGLAQRDPKTVLAYSSISQMGLATVAVGAALLAPGHADAAMAAAAIFAVHHGLAKTSLFLSVGVVEARLSRGWHPWVGLGLAVTVLAMAAAPVTGGAVAKKAIEGAAAGLPRPWDGFVPFLLSLTSMATLLLLLRFGLILGHHHGRKREAPARSMGIAWAASVIAAAGTLWVLPWAGAPARVDEILSADAIVGGAWPLAVGLALAVGLHASAQRWRWRAPPVPAGDLVVLGERAVVDARRWWYRVTGAAARVAAAARSGAHGIQTRSTRTGERLLGLEASSGWTAGALVTLLAAGVLFAWLAWG